MSCVLRDPRLQLVGAQAGLASLMVIGREALASMPPGVIVWARTLGGCVVFSLIARIAGDRTRIARRDVVRLIVCGSVGTASNQLFLLYGLARTTAVNASVLSTTIPVITLLVALLFRIEVIQIRRVIGIVLALVGATMLVGLRRLSLADDYAIGNLLVLGNCASWAVFFALARPLVRAYRPMKLASWLFAIGTIVSAPICVPQWLAFLPAITARNAAHLAFLIAVPTVGTYALNQIAMRRAEPSVVAASWYLLPLFGTLGAMLWLGERPPTDALLAAGLILAGLYLASIAARSARRSPIGTVAQPREVRRS
jgi:drug/metabolite transporter (DMT)-like permease